MHRDGGTRQSSSVGLTRVVYGSNVVNFFDYVCDWCKMAVFRSLGNNDLEHGELLRESGAVCFKARWMRINNSNNGYPPSGLYTKIQRYSFNFA